MNIKQGKRHANLIAEIIFTLFLSVFIGVVFLNPIWKLYSPPFPMERVFPAIVAPVDGPFYLQNAIQGYQWQPQAILSIWFHPLLPWLVSLLSGVFSPEISFWLISIVFAIGCFFLLEKINSLYGFEIAPGLLPLILVVPGGLSIATGNPEIPTLFFSSALLLSVLVWQKWSITFLCGVLAILTKPNALYMVPYLTVYILVSLYRRDKIVLIQSFIGIFGILLGWAFWIVFVDLKIGEFGSYWEARRIASSFVAGNPINFLVELANSFIYKDDIRDQIRYSTALIIPLVNIWFISRLSFPKEAHRYAITAGILSMLVIALMYGNPNKIIVYIITLPGYFSVYFMLIQSILDKQWRSNLVNRFLITPLFVIYCVFMLYVYIVGTPSGWYY